MVFKDIDISEKYMNLYSKKTDDIRKEVAATVDLLFTERESNYSKLRADDSDFKKVPKELFYDEAD